MAQPAAKVPALRTLGPAERPLPADQAGRRPFSDVVNGAALTQVLEEVLRGCNGSLMLEGSARKVPVRLSPLANDSQAILATCTAGPPPHRQAPFATVWFTARDGVYAFQSPILDRTDPKIRLAWPTRLVRYIRRKQPRYPITSETPAELEWELADGNWAESTVLIDLSLGGAAAVLSGEYRVPLDEKLSLRLNLFNAKPLYINAAVRHASRWGAGGLMRYGLEFVELPPLARLALQRAIDRMATATR